MLFRLTLTLGVLFVLQACESTLHEITAGAAVSSMRSIGGPIPLSCDSVRFSNGHVGIMPDDVLNRIARGQGLPPSYLSSGQVPRDFCKPKNGVWHWPKSGHPFYNANAKNYATEHLSAQEISTIEKIKQHMPPGERDLVKWMVWPGYYHLWVFELKPYKDAWYGDFAPYYALNYGHAPYPSEFIDAETGQPWAAPPQ